jgi:DNA modification methylase
MNVGPLKRALKIKTFPTGKLCPYENNARTHSEAQIEQLCASLQEFGWTNPILIDAENRVIAGHARLQAAEKLGIAEVPCLALDDLTEAQRKAYIIADNKLALNAGWDEPLLGAELLALDGMGFDCELTGFSGDELEGLFARAQSTGEGLTDEDAVPEAQDEIVSQAGDVWLCGRHRVRCGDSTKAEDVEALLAGVEPHLMVTDPPYGVNFDPTWRKGSESRTYMPPKDDKISDWREAWACSSAEVAYVWSPPGPDSFQVFEGLRVSGYEIRAHIIWSKMRFIIGRGHYCYNHELCFYAVRKGKIAHWTGARNQASVWEIEHKASGTNHGAQKPVECMRRPIVNNSSPGQAVYDPFLGSGTTMIAAEKEGRVCYGMEIAPQYVDVCVRRWQDFTGKEAMLDGDGRSFTEIAEQGHVAGGGADERGGGVRPGGPDASADLPVVRPASADHG